jgi:hypothetical protein
VQQAQAQLAGQPAQVQPADAVLPAAQGEADAAQLQLGEKMAVYRLHLQCATAEVLDAGHQQPGALPGAQQQGGCRQGRQQEQREDTEAMSDYTGHLKRRTSG